jgi:hypothetical protein
MDGYGNRLWGNKVNVKNFYKISYPGYNEIFTGHTDAFSSPNLPVENPHVNVLEYLNASSVGISWQGSRVHFLECLSLYTE